MKISIRNKLLLWFTVLIVLSAVTQIIFNVFFADTFFTKYKEQSMQNAFEDIEETYDGSIDTLSILLNEIEETHNIHLVIRDEEGIIYVSYMELMAEEYISDITSEEILRESNSSKNKKNSKPDELTLVQSFEYMGETISVEMFLPTASIENSVRFFTNSNAIISLLIIIVGIIISTRIAKSITRPIEKVEKISYNLANLEFDEYILEESSTKEVESLAKSINQMSKELKSKIEDLNHANEKLQKDVEYQMQLEQMHREFIANVSHEMKTPLAILQFYCENLKCDIDGIDKEYYYNTIIEEVNRMDEMVKSVLEISAIENGFSKMHLEEMNFSEAVEQVVERMEPLLAEFKIKIEIEKELTVLGDVEYLGQAMKNYITNAVSHTREGGEIYILLARDEEFAKFQVYNEGKPIQQDQIEHIWKSFYKLDKSRVREANTNVGLGLYIVKSIVENHNGLYGVVNENKGVTFEFKIPLLSN